MYFPSNCTDTFIHMLSCTHTHTRTHTHTNTQIPKGLTGFLDYGYNFHTGLFTENSFVLAEGWYEDNIFNVEAFGFPPAEPSKITRYSSHDTDSGITVNFGLFIFLGLKDTISQLKCHGHQQLVLG